MCIGRVPKFWAKGPCNQTHVPPYSGMHPTYKEPEGPTLRGVLASLSPAVTRRWQAIQSKIDECEQHRQDKASDLGQYPTSSGNGQGTFSVCQPSGQCNSRNEGNPALPWDKIASDYVSMGRAVWLSRYKTPRRPMDDNYDIYRPVDFPSL